MDKLRLKFKRKFSLGDTSDSKENPTSKSKSSQHGSSDGVIKDKGKGRATSQDASRSSSKDNKDGQEHRHHHRNYSEGDRHEHRLPRDDGRHREHRPREGGERKEHRHHYDADQRTHHRREEDYRRDYRPRGNGEIREHRHHHHHHRPRDESRAEERLYEKVVEPVGDAELPPKHIESTIDIALDSRKGSRDSSVRDVLEYRKQSRDVTGASPRKISLWEDVDFVDDDADLYAKPEEFYASKQKPRSMSAAAPGAMPNVMQSAPVNNTQERPTSAYNVRASVNPFTKSGRPMSASLADPPTGRLPLPPPLPLSAKEEISDDEPRAYSWSQFQSDLAIDIDEEERRNNPTPPRGRTYEVGRSRWSSESDGTEQEPDTPRQSMVTQRRGPPLRQVEQYISFLCNCKGDSLGDLDEARRWPFFNPPLYNLLDAMAELCIFKERKQTIALALSLPKNVSKPGAACTVFLSHDLVVPEAAVQHLKKLWSLCQKGSRAAFPPPSPPTRLGESEELRKSREPASKEVVIVELFEEMFQYSFAKFRKDFLKHYDNWREFANSVIMIAQDCPSVNHVGTLREDLEPIHKMLLSKPAQAFSPLDRRHIGHSVRTILLKLEQKAIHISHLFRFLKPYNEVWSQSSGKKVDFARYLYKIFRLVFHFRTLQGFTFSKPMQQFLACELAVMTISAVDGSVSRDAVDKDVAELIISECRDQLMSRRGSVVSGKSTIKSCRTYVPRAREFVLDYFSKGSDIHSLAQPAIGGSTARPNDAPQPHLECSLLVFLHNMFRDKSSRSKFKENLMHPYCYIGVSRRPCELSGKLFLVYSRNVKRVVTIGREHLCECSGVRVRSSSGKLVDRWVMPRFSDAPFNSVVRNDFKNDIMAIIANMVDKVEEQWMMKGWHMEQDLGDYKKSINSFIALMNKFGETLENGIMRRRPSVPTGYQRVPTTDTDETVPKDTTIPTENETTTTPSVKEAPVPAPKPKSSVLAVGGKLRKLHR